MRIIDKMHDFYDYLQDSTDNLVFDRRGSYLLTKDNLCTAFNYIYYNKSIYRFVLVQSGATYWLLLVTITSYNNFGNVTNYKLELLSTWKNYNKAIKLFTMKVIDFNSIYTGRLRDDKNFRELAYNKIMDNVNNLIMAVNNDEYKIEYSICDYDKNNKMPLLKACGIGNIIYPSDIFYAIEEYFSLVKTSSERTEPIGVTNDDKIIMHGFDTKISFRGK